MRTETLAVTERTRLRRNHERGSHERAVIHAILDATPLCHIGYVLDGRPVATPTFQWREGDRVYWHGSSAGRALRAQEGKDVCLTVTLLDAMVMARSAFHHSVNSRSAMVFGRPTKVIDPETKTEKLRNFVEQLFPGRFDMLREMTGQELKATAILSMPIKEASAKVRTGPPGDDEEDYALPIWAGVIPIRGVVGEPEPDPRNLEGVSMPDHVGAFRLG